MPTPPLARNPRPAPARGPLPELRPGDRLDRPTFHERYLAMPEAFRAELIGGVVVVPLSASADHAGGHGSVVTWLGVYAAGTPGTRVLAEPTVLLGPESEPEPDAALVVEPARGGKTRLEGSFLAGPPELVVEVAYSSVALDRHAKYRDYEAAGVREYVVVVLHEEVVEWHVARDGRFEPLAAGGDGLFRSPGFPGLWLDAGALLRGDMAAVLRALARGLETPEHAAWAAELAARGG